MWEKLRLTPRQLCPDAPGLPLSAFEARFAQHAAGAAMLESLYQALKAMEWRGVLVQILGEGHSPSCADCGALQLKESHTPFCKLNEALKAAEELRNG